MIPAVSIYERFWSHVDKSGDCWIWTAATSSDGYGHFSLFGMTRAHRISYLLEVGSIPNGMFVCHHCDNPKCVRPDHLFLGTAKDNTHDAIKKGRFQTPGFGENNPHAKLTLEQVNEIRELAKNGPIVKAKIAALYGVHPQAIYEIVKGRSWRRSNG